MRSRACERRRRNTEQGTCMTPQELIDRIANWRTANGVPPNGILSDAYLFELGQAVNGWLMDMSVTAANPAAVAIVYDGKVGGYEAKDLAEDLAERSGGSRYTIADTQAGKLLESADFRAALVQATGSDLLARRLIYGQSEFGLRSQYSVDDVLTFSDSVAQRFASAAHGNVITINAGIIDPTSVLALSI